MGSEQDRMLRVVKATFKRGKDFRACLAAWKLSQESLCNLEIHLFSKI